MLAHVSLRVADRAASERFYRTVLSALGHAPTHERADVIAWEDFALSAADGAHPPTRHVHIGFGTSSPAGADAFWAAGRAAGHPDDGAPGPRPIYGPDYYGGFLRDPDGNSAEAAHHDDVRPGAVVDHLWIRVRDLEASAAFYETLAACTGLRTGKREATRRQFHGAWGELSLLADGQPVTENLHVAFPAPNRRTVDAFHAAALAAGYRSHGAPGERPQYGAAYYAAYVIDPDGHNIESVCRTQPRS